MIQVQPSGYEDNLQLIPGSELRDAALVESIDELKAQMDLANNKIVKRRKMLLVATSVVAIAGIFLYGGKLAKGLKYIGILLGVVGMIKGATNAKNSIQQMPHSKDFSARDRAYSFMGDLFAMNDKQKLIGLITNVTLGLLLASKLIKPSDILEKKVLIRSNRSNLSADIKTAILNYNVR